MDRLEAMSIVLEVAEAGSLAGAALDARQRDLPSAADVENPERHGGTHLGKSLVGESRIAADRP